MALKCPPPTPTESLYNTTVVAKDSLPHSLLPVFKLSGCITGGPTPTHTPAGMHRNEGVCEQVCEQVCRHLLSEDTPHIL